MNSLAHRQLTYRLNRPTDIPDLLRLWEENTGWGSMTEERWRQWYVDTPYGPCFIPVAVDDDGKIKGQGVFTPSRLSCEGVELKAMRVSSPILDKHLRAAPKSHPVSSLYRTGVAAARLQDFTVVYAFPDKSLENFLRKYIPELALVTLDCVMVSISQWQGAGSNERIVKRADHFGEEYRTLWNQWRQSSASIITTVRSPEWLAYRFGAMLTLEVRNPAGILLGYTVIDLRTNLITDCLATASNELAPVLQASISWLAEQDNAPKELKAMRTPFLAPTFDSLGFAANEFKFLFGRSIVNPDFSSESFDLERWHFMPGD